MPRYTGSVGIKGCCSKYFNSVWYMTNIVPLCTLVHTARGPTPRNQPANPSVRYITRRPVRTDDVSNVTAEWCLRDVDGDEVEIGRLGCIFDFCGFEVEDVECFEGWFEDGEDDGEGGEGFPDGAFDSGIGEASGLCWVCILVFTTSSGQVRTPAIPPAVAAVAISNPKPMSLCPTHAFASFCSCS